MNTKAIMPIVLSVVGAAGVVATSILVAKQTPKFNEDYSKLKEGGIDTKANVVKVFLKDYALPLVVGGATIASIASSTILSKKNEISLSAAAMLADKGWRKYKDKVKEMLGVEKHEDILSALSLDDSRTIDFSQYKNLYWEEHVGFFEANPEKLAYAYGDLNRALHDEEYNAGSYIGITTLSRFLTNAEANILDENVKNNPDAMNFGWDIDYLYDVYGNVWVNMVSEEMTDSEGHNYTKIMFLEEAIHDPRYYSENK